MVLLNDGLERKGKRSKDGCEIFIIASDSVNFDPINQTRVDAISFLPVGFLRHRSRMVLASRKQ